MNVAVSDNLVDWTPLLSEDGSLLRVMEPRKGFFDSSLTECGPPAVLTKKGIVLIYNGKNVHGEEADPLVPPGAYCPGEALFDRADPTRLVDRLDTPVMKPEAEFATFMSTAKQILIWPAQLPKTQRFSARRFVMQLNVSSCTAWLPQISFQSWKQSLSGRASMPPGPFSPKGWSVVTDAGTCITAVPIPGSVSPSVTGPSFRSPVTDGRPGLGVPHLAGLDTSYEEQKGTRYDQESTSKHDGGLRASCLRDVAL